jgi:hypothetical protein
LRPRRYRAPEIGLRHAPEADDLCDFLDEIQGALFKLAWSHPEIDAEVEELFRARLRDLLPTA